MSKYHENLSKEQIELMEKLASLEHTRWADWQKYLHDKCSRHPDGLLISKSDVDHWERQIETDYKDLSEAEKDSDREQVFRYWKLIN